MADNNGASAPPDFDGFIAKLGRILERQPKGGDLDDDDGGRGRSVDYARFFKANQRRKAAEEALQTMQAEVEALRLGATAEVERIKAAAADQAVKLQGRHQIDLGLVDAGFDADGRDALRAYWSRVPEADRGGSPLEWWGGQVEAVKAHRADPQGDAPRLPRTLAPYLPPEPVAEATPAAAPSNAPTARPGRSPITVAGINAGAFRVDQNVVARADTNTQLDAVKNAGSMGEFLAAIRGQ